jgi:hypothetical protein
VNLNFSGLKINDSKKRVKQPFFPPQTNESEHDPNHSTDMLCSNEDYNDNETGSLMETTNNSAPVIQGAQDDPTRRFYKAKRMKP